MGNWIAVTVYNTHEGRTDDATLARTRRFKGSNTQDAARVIACAGR